MKLLSKMKVVAGHYRVMGAVNATRYVVQRLSRKNRIIFARIGNTGLSIQLRNDPYDTQIFTQIFVRGELDIPFDSVPEIIIDGGANIGLATLYLKNRFPNATIVAIEPERANFELLVANTRSYDDVFCVNKGIWNESGRLEIVDNGDGNASFITRAATVDSGSAASVDAITIADIMSEFSLPRLDLLKLDIEGSEKDVFERNFSDWLARTQNVIVEIHPHLRPDCERTVKDAFGEDFAVTQSGEYTVFSRKAAVPSRQ